MKNSYLESNTLFVKSLLLFLLLGINCSLNLALEDVECGKWISQEAADKGEWPWKVAIFLTEPGSRKFRCGGTLISKDWLVTSARCVAHSGRKITFGLQNLDFYFGVVNEIYDLAGPNLQKIRPAEIILHEKFDPGTTGSDIALVRLEKSVEFNDAVRPICLWQEDINISNVVGKTGIITSYDVSGGKFANEQTEELIEPIDVCLNAHPVFLIGFNLDRTLCAGKSKGTRTCPGQTGGGMYLRKSDNADIWQLRALKSTALYSHPVGADCGQTDYVLYADVVQYIDWIKLKTQVNSKPSAEKNKVETLLYNRGCGKVPLKAAPLIRHGQNTTINDWPWHLAIYRISGPDLSYSCGGSLISDQFVLTAAHCITEIGFTTPIPLEHIQMHLGINKLRELTSGIQTHLASKIIVHPAYNASTLYNDIGLIKSQNRVKFTNTIWPVCLWTNDDDIASLYGKYGTVVGWGITEHNTFSNQLQMTQFPVISITTCLASDRLFFSTYIYRDNYCAGYYNGTTACSGDSGGGMFFEREPGVWHIRGLISVGAVDPISQSCHQSHYVLLTDVAKYLVWIKNEMN